MKQPIYIIILIAMTLACNEDVKNSYPSIEGEWRRANANKGCEMVFKKGFYNLTRWEDDIVNVSEGKYFFNENKKRITKTITLVPNLQYRGRDTIILPCENIDLISLTDSLLIIQKPTEWVREADGHTAMKNDIEKYSRRSVFK